MRTGDSQSQPAAVACARDLADYVGSMTFMRFPRRALVAAAGAAFAFAVMAAAVAFGSASGQAAQAAATPSMALALRYIGRDGITGLPAPINDHFIAAAAQSIARYGKDASKPIPPPLLTGTDVSTLTIPALGIQAVPVRRYGLDAYGRLDVPQDADTIAWNPGYSALPGTGGATFFAAHFEFGGQPGVFKRLSTLKPGDTITVALTDGTRHNYSVTSAVDYSLAAIDMGAILQGREGTESITLMTCSGPPGPDGYPLRTVVLADAVP